jgi:uncharacterized protein Yka (UPF0111/DUF47 family)
MDSLIPEGIRQLASQGTGWLLFLFAGAACIWLFRRLLAVLEKMIEDGKTAVLALRENGEANTDLAQSVQARTGAFDRLAEAVMQLIRDISNNDTAWRDRVSRLEKNLDEIRAEQREVRRLLDIRERGGG